MRTITFLTFHLLAVFFMFNCYAEAENCVGCVQDADPNNPEIKKQLEGVLAYLSGEYDIIKVIRAKTQDIIGIRYIVDFEVKDRRTNTVKLCHTTFISQPGKLELPFVEQFFCRDE